MNGLDFFFYFLTVSFFLLAFALFDLQIIHGEENRTFSEENRIRIEKILALRGVIYDQNGKILVRNTPEGREYLYKEVTAHFLGFIGEASVEDLRERKLELGDIVGKGGIEAFYDEILRGVDGGVLIETDAAGKKIREIGKKEPIAGKSLILNIDYELQEKIFEILADKKAAAVAATPKGEILALVSSPSFDPNRFTIKSKVSLEEILNDQNQPLFNRALAGLYPPGSTFKIVTAIAGLQESKIDKTTQIEDTGEIKIGQYRFGNWYFDQYGKKEGNLNIVGAIRRSNDIFFYRVGEKVGIEKLAFWAEKFGLGSLTGIDLPGEAAGNVPTPDDPWFLGDTFITAIGQGDLLATPLQVNQLAAVVANGGELCSPRVLKEVKENGEEKGEECQDLGIKKENLKLVAEGMKQACNRGGTGFTFFDFGAGGPATTSADFKRIEVGCKTGTAEVSKTEKPHAWFTVFAPFENPEIVLTILLENAGEGSREAGPIATKILKWWFEKKVKS